MVTACDILQVPRSSVYRARQPNPAPRPPVAPVRALSEAEREVVHHTLNSERFADQAPREVYATLLDEGTYLCSPRTMYRVLEEHAEVRERRDQLRHPAYAKPELLATSPNRVWSWDITKLLGPTKWTSYYLYVMLDIFSRYVVGWLIADRESGALAEVLIAEACAKQRIGREKLTIHADNGGPMIAKPVALLMIDLGVTKSHSRPHVSNDNPFSEAQFKTMKYQPDYPERLPMSPPEAGWAGAWRSGRCAPLGADLLPVVQRRASPQRNRLPHAGGRALWRSVAALRRAAAHSEGGLCSPSGTLC